MTWRERHAKAGSVRRDARRAPPPPEPCPHHPDCAGCALIGRPYGEQLRCKQDALAATLAGAGLDGAEFLPIVGSPRVFGYRTQCKLVVRRAGRGVLMGVYRPGTHQVVDISACVVHHPLIAHVVEAVRAEIVARDLSVYDERTGRGLVRYLCVRVSTWQKRAQLILVTAARAVPDARGLVRALQRRVRGLASVVQNVNADPGNVILGPLFVPWTKETSLTERVGPLRLHSRAGSFLQANVQIARRLYEVAAAWAAPEPDDVAADLYCGVGALALHLAATARHVVGIESSPTAVLDGQVNIRLNGVHNVRFRRGAVADELPRVREQLRRIDVIAVNPPRKGLDAEARAAVAACAPRRIVYVSCEPATLARDLAWFCASDYRLRRVQALDMFPQTDHVETVALLER